jgi:hypothetical protein
MSENLVTGVKEQLLAEFRQLYKIHQKGWRKKLKMHNSWHATEQGIHAWRNISTMTTGNEALRQIISDMQAITASSRTKATVQRQGLTRRQKA